jgi:hypothetical protein
VVGLGQGTTQEGEGGAGSTLSKVSTEGAHRYNGTRRRRSGIRRARVHDKTTTTFGLGPVHGERALSSEGKRGCMGGGK